MSGDDEVAAGLRFYAFWALRGVLPAQIDAMERHERVLMAAAALGNDECRM